MDFHLHRLAVSLPTRGKPVCQSTGQALHVNAKSSLKPAITGGKRVVKLGRAGKISHGESVKPLEWAGAPLATNDNLNFELTGVQAKQV